MKKRLLGILMLTFLIGGGSLFTLAENITVASTDFPLGTNVVGKWDKDNQTLTMTGQGKIEKSKWQSLVSKLGLKNQGTEEVKINFWKEVRFPDNASDFFMNFQSKYITFDSEMKTDNLTNMKAMFRGAKYFNTDINHWNVSKVSNMEQLFQDAENFNQPLINRDTSKVWYMSNMFNGAKKFNQALTNWKTQNVVHAITMFKNAESFNSDVSGWDLSNAQKLEGMFQHATIFNQPLTNWKTSEKLTMLNQMFSNAEAFNQDVSHLNTKNVRNLDSMFYKSAFNKDISNWDVGNVTSMAGTFAHSKFVGDISNWDVGKVTTMNNMFAGTEFNGDISNWNVSSVTTMRSMFQSATAFNGDLSKWDTSNVTDMSYMFGYTTAFEGKGIWKWNVDKVENVFQMFFNAKKFNQDLSGWKLSSLVPPTNPQQKGGDFIHYHPDPILSFSSENYDKLIKQRADNLPSKENPINIKITVPYCSEETLINKKKLKDKNYIIISPDKRDCNLHWTITSLYESTTAIDVKITVESLLPADKMTFKILDDTTVTHTAPSCAIEDWVYTCRFQVTSTDLQTKKLHFKISDGVKEKDPSFDYLIDNQWPAAPEVKIDASDLTKPKIKIPNYPHDAGTGTKSCSAIYTDKTNNDKTIDIPENVEVELSDIKELPENTDQVHTVKIQCKDKLNNLGEEKIVKFPPIVEFDQSNTTIVQIGDMIEGKFSIYPRQLWKISKNLIFEGISDLLDDRKITCEKETVQQEYPSTSIIPSDAYFEEVEKEHPVLCTYTWKVKDPTPNKPIFKVHATDMYNAQGNNSQTFTLDHEIPTINISPDEIATWSDTKVTITVRDDVKIDKEKVEIAPQLPVGFSINDQECKNTDEKTVICTLTIAAADKNYGEAGLTVKATDTVGHFHEKDSWTYKIDKLPPTLSNLITGLNLTTKTFTASFDLQDQGLGLRKKTEESEENYDINAISYGIAKADCSDFSSKGTIEPQNTESFNNLSFDLNVADDQGAFICILARDKAKNLVSKALGKIDLSTPSSPSTPSTPSTSQVGYSGGGGGSSMRRDNCPNGDHSPSYYDGSCGTQQNEKKPESSDKAQTPVGEKKAYQENDLFNPNIEDGKCYTRRPHLGILTSQLIPTTEEYNKAQSFLWSYEMTKYDSVDGYDPYRYLSRQEAAKIFSNFAINVLCRQPNKKLTVNYSDTQDADPSLKPYIELAYQLGIMKGSGQGDGSFRPYEFISKAEVNAVLIRMLLKSYLDETGLLRYTPYNQTSHTLNIISQEAGLEPIARNHVALMLFRAYKQQSFDWKEIDYFSYVLKNRADFVK